MNHPKWILFLVSISLMMIFFVWLGNLNGAWQATIEMIANESDQIVTNPTSYDKNLLRAKQDVLEYRIFNIEMLVSVFTFINGLVLLVYFTQNYQALKDRWRKFRGIEPKPFLIAMLKR